MQVPMQVPVQGPIAPDSATNANGLVDLQQQIHAVSKQVANAESLEDVVPALDKIMQHPELIGGDTSPQLQKALDELNTLRDRVNAHVQHSAEDSAERTQTTEMLLQVAFGLKNVLVAVLERGVKIKEELDTLEGRVSEVVKETDSTDAATS